VIDEKLLAEEPWERPPGVYWVTDLTGPCLRRSYYNITEPRPHGVETLRVFEAGRILEDYWARLLERRGYTVLGRQVAARALWGGVAVHGRADVLTVHPVEGLCVHEVKTMVSLSRIQQPKPEHIMQLHFYMSVLGVERGQLDYLDRGAFWNGKVSVSDRVFPVRIAPHIMSVFKVRALRLHEAVESGVPPEACPGWMCDYCLHRDLCRGGES